MKKYLSQCKRRYLWQQGTPGRVLASPRNEAENIALKDLIPSKQAGRGLADGCVGIKRLLLRETEMLEN